MKITYILPILSAVGFLFATYTVFSGSQPVPIAQPVAEPASAPYKTFIAGSGLIEAKSRNIAIGTPLSRLVKQVAVQVGDTVDIGTALFYLDDSDVLAELAVKKANLAKAQAELAISTASLTDAQSLYELAANISDARAISHEEVLKRRNALAIAKAKQTGAEAAIKQAQAEIANTETTLKRLVVTAPMPGEILQVNIRPGEFAQAGALVTPLIVLGNLDQLHVRVDIDENDVWRFDKTGSAIAYVRGNKQLHTELKLAYVEPYIIPKKSLTGDSTERVDTRVLQALYSFDRKQLPVFVGQQMDVFIETHE